MPCCPKQRLHGWSHSLLKTPTHTFHFQGLVNTLWSTSCLGSIPILRSWSPFTKKTYHPAKYREMAILEFPSKMLHFQAAQWSHVLSPISWGPTTTTVRRHVTSWETLGISPMGILPSGIRLSRMSQHGGPCNQSYTTHLLFYWSLLGCRVCYVRCEQTSIYLR